MTVIKIEDQANVVAVSETEVVTVAVLEVGPQGPPGAGTDLGYTAATRLLTSSTGADVTLPLFTSADAGLTPYSGGGTTNFLRADGSWAAPPGGVGTVTSVGLSAPTGFTVSDSPVTSSGTLTFSFTAGYSLPTTSSQTNWDTAYTERRQWDGGSTSLVAATGRTSLGLGGAAVLNVGTSAGTVAAGDDSRITGALSSATAASTYQPLDSDLTAIAALSTTSFGRSLLTQADAAAARTTLGAGTGDGTVTNVTGTAPIISSGGATPAISISAATNSAAGSMSASDKAKLDGIASGAQVNVATDLTYTASTRLLESSTGSDATLPLFTSTDAGLTPSSGGGTSNYLRADGTWAVPPGGAGSVTSVGLSAPTGFTISNSPITSSGTIALAFTAGYSLPTTASQTTWDSAYTERRQWDGGSTNLVAATGRTSLGLGGAATLNVGTTAGTVAVGNDSRFAGANLTLNSLCI